MIQVKYGSVEIVIDPVSDIDLRAEGDGIIRRVVQYRKEDLQVAVLMVRAAIEELEES